jgi:predicted nucleotide-binding protein
MADPPLAKLLVPRAEAEEKITAQINSGRKIVSSLGPPPGIGLGFDRAATLQSAMTEGTKWAKFTIDLLKGLITDLWIEREFGDSDIRHYGGDQTTEFLKWMDQRLHGLDSILQRLPLFPSALKPVQATAAPTPPKQQSRDIFMVHGHDGEAKHEVARFIEHLGLHPIILHEKPDKGRTVIEKVEHHSDVGFAIVLLTPDDVGHPKDKPDEPKPRARQNVVLELGYFIGKLGRARVCALLKSDIEIPTDFAGVLYKPMDATGNWRLELAREIKAAGIDVDLNKLS